ncbi:hypothetical protein JG688_00014435 [Phytophthora aleatoria]|uniref:Uncharacterized protein n=1 Tax=Phytophthora aleatoria TaxID=2496075 RepID=A0A8J5I7C6_9STRA|nr:hypothetical protein JG688_00014435 [Phytophthora aleatoria]
MKNAIQGCTDNETDFAAGWELAGDRFKERRRFSGVLATVFPNTATGKAAFSIIGWEKNEYQKSVTDFLFEGILFAKQLDIVSTLAINN